MSESLTLVSPQPAAVPIVISLSPRDCFCVHASIEAAIIDQRMCGLAEHDIQPFVDLELRFRRFLKAGGYFR